MSRKITSSITALSIVFALLPAISDAQTYVVQRLHEDNVKGYGDVHVSRAAMPGQKIRVWFATLTNPDCTPAGTMTTQVVTAPRHGQAEISTDKVFPNFIPPNPRVACDKQKVDGVQAFYTPDADFHGHDHIVLQNATSEGRVRRVLVDVDVR